MTSLVVDSRFGLVLRLAWLGCAPWLPATRAPGPAPACTQQQPANQPLPASQPANQQARQPTGQPPSQPSSQPANWLSIEVGVAHLIPASQIAIKPAKIDDRNRRPENGVIAPYLGTLSSVFCRSLGSGSSSEIPHALFPFPTRIRIGIRIRIRIRT